MVHTPTPWATFGWKDGSTCGIQGTQPMHRVTSDNVFLVDDDKDMANAAFIVKAVNCHDELVEALKLAMDYVEEYGLVNVLCEDENKMRQALAKAEA